MRSKTHRKSAMHILSDVLTMRGIAHEQDPAEDDSMDDGVNITTLTTQGHSMSVQCVTPFSPRDQADYLLSVFDQIETFHHILDSETSDPQKVADVIAEFIIGTRTIQDDA